MRTCKFKNYVERESNVNESTLAPEKIPVRRGEVGQQVDVSGYFSCSLNGRTKAIFVELKFFYLNLSCFY
ncbi:hypothetical protein K7X08_036376 [Anisodus acutangulus]|uniref:Uncharacterized protein n=1 Tax=Anisodus acutangulus TaxID=402998 RepID=A0A9Q1QW71_9SOLA|nr:hypothetical protein K7X08_036376 [Anisodus acutangulus]